jgi:hypothetical protein
MARVQVNSGGYELDETIRYAVFVQLDATTAVTAILDTEPEELPEGYTSWLEGSGHELTVIEDPAGMVTVATQEAITVLVTGNVLTITTGNLYVSLPGAPAGELPDEGMMMIMSKWMGN